MEMKEIIYLDTGVLHSFLAQNNDGLPTATSNERGEEVNDIHEKSKGFNSRTAFETKLKTGKFEIPVLLKTPEGEAKLVLQPGRFSSKKAVISQTETGKEIISKQLHDNALEVFETHLKKEDLLFSTNDPALEGKFVKCVSSFKIIDFKYLKSILQPKALVEFMFIKSEEEIEKAEREIKKAPKEQQPTMKAYVNQLTSKVKAEKKLIEEQLIFAEKSINYLNDILPTESFILMENTIAPLKNEYLREKASELMFKYGGTSTNLQMTMIGKVTQKVNGVGMPDFSGNDTFFEFPKILSAVLNPLGIINEGDLIISPIAIYFE
jgi:hypothetical protein